MWRYLFFRLSSKEGWLVICFFSLLCFIGGEISDGYGLGWDEPAQREIGQISYNYAFRGDTTLNNYLEADHGPIFEMLLIGIEEFCGLSDSEEIYRMRHWMTHLFFLLGAFFFLKLLLLRNYSVWWGLLGALFLVLSPRIYTESFVNTKDIPFMVLFIISLWAMIRAFQLDSYKAFALLGFCCGLMLSIRILGIFLVVLILACLLLDLILEKANRKKILAHLGIFSGTFLLIMTLSWPYLWSAPLTHFIETFSNFKNFRWTGEVFYFGELISGTELPWHYIPAWIGISTPILYLLLSLAGLLLLFVGFVSSPKDYFKNGAERELLIIAACLLGPIMAVILFGSVVYDGWRHLFFVYPSLLFFAIYALHRAVHYWYDRLANFFIGLAVVVALLGILLQSFLLYPYGNVYCNQFLPREDQYLLRSLDMDVWGLTYKDGLDYILRRTSANQKVRVFAMNKAGIYAAKLLPKEQRERIQFVIDKGLQSQLNETNIISKEERSRFILVDDFRHADIDYIITNYRRYKRFDVYYGYGEKVFNIERQGSPILSVFKL